MDFYGFMNLTRLPFTFEERLYYDGRERNCLCIPLDNGVMRRSRHGEWEVMFNAFEDRVGKDGHTHRLKLRFSSEAKRNDARRGGWATKREWYGRLVPELMTMEERIEAARKRGRKDRTNRMTPIVCTGQICLDDIRPEDIETNAKTGKRYVRCTFRRTKEIGDYEQSHQIVVSKGDGSEHEVGWFRQLVKETRGMAAMDKADANAPTWGEPEEVVERPERGDFAGSGADLMPPMAEKKTNMPPPTIEGFEF